MSVGSMGAWRTRPARGTSRCTSARGAPDRSRRTCGPPSPWSTTWRPPCPRTSGSRSCRYDRGADRRPLRQQRDHAAVSSLHRDGRGGRSARHVSRGDPASFVADRRGGRLPPRPSLRAARFLSSTCNHSRLAAARQIAAPISVETHRCRTRPPRQRLDSGHQHRLIHEHVRVSGLRRGRLGG